MIQFHRESNNCFQDVIAMILKNNGEDPFMMYQGCLNFGYNKGENIYGNRITPSRDGSWLDNSLADNLYNGNGMMLLKKQTSDIEEVLFDIFFEETKGIILKVDVYDCDWHIFKKKYHSEHYCWVVRYDDYSLKCALPYGEKWGNYKIENLQAMELIEYYVFKFVEKKNVNNIMEIVKKTVCACERGWNGISDIHQMILMRNDIATIGIDLKKEIEGIQDIIAVPVVRAFEWIAWSRLNYRDLLIRKNQNGEVDILIAEVDSSARIWTGIKNYVIRDIIRGNVAVNCDFIKYIDRVISKEQKIIEIMRSMKESQ